MPTFNFEGGSISSDFENDVSNPWVIQTTDVNGGTYGIEAEAGNDAESSNFFLFGDFDAGDVTFYEKISSEASYDFGRFYIDGNEPGSESLEVSGAGGSFTLRTITITAGVNALHWCYSKDSVDPGNDDTWYVDDIVVPAYTLFDLSEAERMNAVPTGTEWTDDATYPWRTYSRGMFAAGAVRSGSITHSQSTDLIYDSDTGAGAGTAITVFRNDAEGNFDNIEYDIDTVNKKTAGGNGGANSSTPKVSIETVTSGTHEYKWNFAKDGSDTLGRDQGELFLFYEPGMSAALEAAIGLGWQENAWVNAGWASGAWATTVTVTGSGTPAAQSATMTGAGTTESTGSGTPAAQSATITGAGDVANYATGTPAAQAATITGAGTSESTGTGTLAAQDATATGAGEAAVVGSGTPVAQSATITGAGTTESTGAGTPAAQSSAITGAGTVKWTGTGALTAQSATITGAGVTESVGTGALAGTATITGAGTTSSTGTGAIVADGATVAGIGTAGAPVGQGAMAADDATITGAGTTESTGSGSPQAQSATITGVGASESTGSGALVSGVSTASGAGNVGNFANGTPQAQSATITGAGTAASVGTGALVAQYATTYGTDTLNTYNWNSYSGRPGGDSGSAFQTKPV